VGRARVRACLPPPSSSLVPTLRGGAQAEHTAASRTQRHELFAPAVAADPPCTPATVAVQGYTIVVPSSGGGHHDDALKPYVTRIGYTHDRLPAEARGRTGARSVRGESTCPASAWARQPVRGARRPRAGKTAGAARHGRPRPAASPCWARRRGFGAARRGRTRSVARSIEVPGPCGWWVRRGIISRAHISCCLHAKSATPATVAVLPPPRRVIKDGLQCPRLASRCEIHSIRLV